jgi:anti-anti-sigma factor
MPDLNLDQTAPPAAEPVSPCRLELKSRQAPPGVLVLALGGDAEDGEQAALDRWFEGELETHKPGHVLLDLRELEFAGQAFLSSLLYWRESVRAAAGRLVLFGARPEVASTFRMSGIDRILRIRSDEATALEAAQSP